MISDKRQKNLKSQLLLDHKSHLWSRCDFRQEAEEQITNFLLFEKIVYRINTIPQVAEANRGENLKSQLLLDHKSHLCSRCDFRQIA